MNLQKAIEILQKLAVKGSGWRIVDDCEACQLGIEALKYHLHRRVTAEAIGSPLLPGETQD